MTTNAGGTIADGQDPAAVAGPSTSAPVSTPKLVDVQVAPSAPEDEELPEVEDMEHLQLSLQEAFFLSWALDCLSVLDPSTVSSTSSPVFFHPSLNIPNFLLLPFDRACISLHKTSGKHSSVAQAHCQRPSSPPFLPPKVKNYGNDSIIHSLSTTPRTTISDRSDGS